MKDIIEKFWITEESYPAVVRFNRLGYRIGYVGVQKSNKLYGKHYDDIDIICHWGLTYSDKQFSTKNYKSYPTKKEEYDDFWFFGFDASHSKDAPDINAYMNLHKEQLIDKPIFVEDIIRSLDYMIEQCESISKQLYELSNH